MRFRPKSKLNKSKEDIKKIAKIIKDKGITPQSALNNALSKYKGFQDAYLKQLPEMERKIKIANGEHKTRLIEFHKDMKILYDFSLSAIGKIQSRGIMNKLRLVKFINIDLQKMMIRAGQFRKKYKHERCNIDNFLVG